MAALTEYKIPETEHRSVVLVDTVPIAAMMDAVQAGIVDDVIEDTDLGKYLFTNVRITHKLACTKVCNCN